MANRLIHETSPYLLQHAHNPVDWYPWGEEALAEARAQDKPIFLSIGYSACHWCHVMAHESFEDPETAAIMNEHFVNIKVDREERPDLDSIYMQAVVAMTGGGGWPMSVFLTPDGTPFYGGTYFPPINRQGMPSFKRVLLSIAQAYRQQHQQIQQGGQQLREQIGQSLALRANPSLLSGKLLDQAYSRLATRFDATYGGFGGAPKFPQPMTLEFLLRYHHRTGESRALDMVDLTLTRMATGGIYDQLGGGFHRYSTDARWLVPHFEKMLYDNALLARVYLHAWQITGRPLYRRVAEETLDYVIREMTAGYPGDSDDEECELGGFYSAQDADSEGEEGKFFLWTPDQVEAILGQEQAEIFCRYFDVTPAGNFEGKNILNVKVDLGTAAAAAGMDEEGFRAIIEEGKARLFRAREDRVKPSRDEKVLTGWNGLMLAALAEASRVLDRPDYLQVAQCNARFVLSEMRQEGRLLRSWKQASGAGKGRARFNAYLEDYAFYADGLLELYQATFEPGWFSAARALTDAILAHFSDPQGGFFDTSHDHEDLISRPKNVQDNAIPSGNAMAAEVLLRLAAYTAADEYRRPAEEMLAAMIPAMQQYAGGFGHWLSALTFHLAPAREIALIGGPTDDDMRALLKVVFNTYRPHQVVALTTPDEETATNLIPLLAGRPQRDGRSTAYVCQQFVCQAPVTDPESLAEQIS
jgi:uncharacterized protein YyaL (SSP411 family)